MGFGKTLAKTLLPIFIFGGVGRGIYVNNYNSKLDEKIQQIATIQRNYGLEAVSRNMEWANEFHRDFNSRDTPYMKNLMKEAQEFQKKADSYQPEIDSLVTQKISYFDFL